MFAQFVSIRGYKLSENRINGYSILNKTKIKNIMWLLVTWQHLLLKFNWKIDLQNKFDLKGGLRILPKLSFSPLITSAIVRYIYLESDQLSSPRRVNQELNKAFSLTRVQCVTQEHPTAIFGKISVRKTIWDLEFSEHLL